MNIKENIIQKKDLLPHITRQKNPDMEEFIVKYINEEIEKYELTDEHLDLIQMQYFFEGMFQSWKYREELLRKAGDE